MGKGTQDLEHSYKGAVNQPEPLSRFAPMLQSRLIAALESWTNKKTLVTFDEAKKLTFENIGKLFVSFEPGPILDSLNTMFAELLKGFRSYPMINFPGTAYYRARESRKNITKIFENELNKRKAKNYVNGTKDIEDLMDGLMRFQDDEGKQLCDIEILDNIVSLVLAGYASTTLAITWALYYLAMYPDVLQKLREENMSFSKNKKGEFITSDEVFKLKFTNKVVDETIRLANVSGILFRRVTKDVDYKGYTIPKGWMVLLWQRYLSMDPGNFENPMCFNPDRWNEAAKPAAYQVFGGGPRICVGNMLARLQLALMIHHLAIGYKWELVNPNAKIVYLPHPKPEDGAEIVFTKL